MKRFVIASVLVFAVFLPGVTAASAMTPLKKFKNCTELRKVYPKGVALSAKAAGQSGAAVNAKVYKENVKSDRDKDGVACELS